MRPELQKTRIQLLQPAPNPSEDKLVYRLDITADHCLHHARRGHGAIASISATGTKQKHCLLMRRAVNASKASTLGKRFTERLIGPRQPSKQGIAMDVTASGFTIPATHQPNAIL